MSRYSEEPGSHNRKNGPNWGKTFAIALSIVLAVVVVLGGVVMYMGHSLFSLTKFQKQNEVQVIENVEDLPEEAIETVSTEARTGVIVNEQELQEIQATMEKVDDTVDTAYDEEVYNLLLVGVDRQDKSWNGNSDSMMLVSINYRAKRVSVISLMRDTYVNIPDVGYAKLNNAYARGGGPLLCRTIEDNYNIELTKYAAVDFDDLAAIIDALGGIDLELSEAECNIANTVYITDMCNRRGLDPADYYIPGAGVWHVNGLQAVGYARNRFVGNSDYARTERQRYVISQMIKRFKELNIAEMTSFVTKVLPLVTHNIDESDIWQLVTKAPDILTYTFSQDRIPYDNMYDVIYVNGQDMLVPYWESTIAKLHNTIYGDGATSDNSDNTIDNREKENSEYNKDELDAAAERDRLGIVEDEGEPQA